MQIWLRRGAPCKTPQATAVRVPTDLMRAAVPTRLSHTSGGALTIIADWPIVDVRLSQRQCEVSGGARRCIATSRAQFLQWSTVRPSAATTQSSRSCNRSLCRSDPAWHACISCTGHRWPIDCNVPIFIHKRTQCTLHFFLIATFAFAFGASTCKLKARVVGWLAFAVASRSKKSSTPP